MNVFFLFGQAAWIPETGTSREASHEVDASYGTFQRDRGMPELEIVLNSTEFVVTINTREERRN